jgi:Arc/MetJ family transcription regulator
LSGSRRFRQADIPSFPSRDSREANLTVDEGSCATSNRRPSRVGKRIPGLEFKRGEAHTIHMKRTNLVLREDLLQEAVRLSGERTYSRTVERALVDFVNRMKGRRILELAGSGAWKGDLSEMRRDPPRRSSRRRAAR